MNDELVDLVNNPGEYLHVELKSMIDLNDQIHKAKLARHIAAISNFGGGYIILGFNNDGTPFDGKAPRCSVNKDAIASITKKYLDPSIDCDVKRVKSDLGHQHVIIIVPPHGSTPVCAKANGPEINGKIQGIESGRYYTRKTGPESAAIVAASEWTDIIRRCALHERSAILAAVTEALAVSNTRSDSKQREDILPLWAKAAKQTYVTFIGDQKFAAPIKDCHIQLSYRVHTEEHETLPHAQFTNILRELSFEVDQQVNTGWSLFYVFENQNMAPTWITDSRAGMNGEDFLEVNVITANRTLGFDLWRASPNGIATVIREYWEDTPNYQRTPRSLFNPKLMAITLSELVRHAEVFSNRFKTPISVEFCCEWIGLKGRQLHVPDEHIFFNNNKAATDTVRTTGTWAVGELANQRPQIVSRLGERVARAFDWHQFTPEWITRAVSRRR